MRKVVRLLTVLAPASFLVCAWLLANLGSPAKAAPVLGMAFNGAWDDISTAPSIDSWLGNTVLYRNSYTDNTDWTHWDSGPWFLYATQAWCAKGPNYREIIALGLLPVSDAGNFGDVSDGAHDADFEAWTQTLVNAGVASQVIIRLGHEFNQPLGGTSGSWYPWGCGTDTAGYAAAFHDAVVAMRTVYPALKICWNPNRGGSQDWASCYPGDDVVDYIGLDAYDNWDPDGWSDTLNNTPGVTQIRNFATLHNKPECYPEWGLEAVSNNGNGDNPSFITNFYNWFTTTGSNVAWESYWNNNCCSTLLLWPPNSTTPNSEVTYQSLFGSSIPVPTGLIATPGNGQVALSWSATTGATSYNIYRGTAAAGEATAPIATGNTTRSYTDAGLAAGTYFYTVTSVNSTGTSGYSLEVSGTPTTAVPNAPTGLTATPGNAQVALSWTAGSGATSYNVYRGTASGGESATAIATGVTSTSYTNTGLTNGAKYYYKVAGVNASGTSGMSNEANATPIAGAPAAPTGLTATQGNAQVGLAWAASSGATSYNLYRGTAAGGESATAVATGITAVSYTNTGLTNGTTYYFKVAAVNAAGTSGMSNEASSMPYNNAPPPPSGLTAAPGNAQVVLSWSSTYAATTYCVYRGTAAGGENSSPVATGITSTTYTNTGLNNGTKYYFTVAAVDVIGTSGGSNEVNATPTGGAPSAPTALTAVAGNAQVALSWTASSGATSYNVYRGTAAGGESATAVATGITAVSYTNTGLTNGTTYYFKVAAVNASGTSGMSNEASATPTGVPSAPSGLTANAGNAQVALSWTASSGATSYNVYRGTAAGGESATAVATGITAVSYTNTGLTNGTTYYYKVAAVNASGTSGMSNEASATPTAGVPSAPTGLTATPGNAQVALSWTASSGATSYNVYRGTSAGGESGTAIATGITTVSYTNTGLTNGTTYYFKVAAVNASGTSGMSNEASATPIDPNVHTGTWSCKAVLASGQSWTNMATNPTCSASQTYVASVWVKGTGNLNLTIMAGNWGASIVSQNFSGTGSWQKITTSSFSTGSNTSLTFALQDNQGGAAGAIYLDDCFLGVANGTNILVDPGFESGTGNWAFSGGSVFSILQNP